jgi:6-phosphofructokinase 1
MGRHSGFISIHASLASEHIDVCLIPKVPFTLDGLDSVLQRLPNMLELKASSILCVT